MMDYQDRFNDPPYLDQTQYLHLGNQVLFYDKTFGGDDWQVFTEADFGFNFGEKQEDANFGIQLM